MKIKSTQKFTFNHHGFGLEVGDNEIDEKILQGDSPQKAESIKAHLDDLARAGVIEIEGYTPPPAARVSGQHTGAVLPALVPPAVAGATTPEEAQAQAVRPVPDARVAPNEPMPNLGPAAATSTKASDVKAANAAAAKSSSPTPDHVQADMVDVPVATSDDTRRNRR